MIMPLVTYEGEASALLARLARTYSQCLAVSRNYMDGCAKEETGDGEFDIDSLQSFLDVRSELFKSAEFILETLFDSGWDASDSSYKDLSGKAVTLLEELSETEGILSEFLSSHFEKMKNTIDYMQKAQPVFRRYSHLGGEQMHPSRITLHE